jgi:hypothetical protein
MPTNRRAKKQGETRRTLTPAQDALFQEIVEELARKDGITAHELLAKNRKPRFLLAIERRARELGISPERVWEQDLRSLRESSYPGPECLTPDDVEQFRATGGMPVERETHLAQCDACRAMLDVTNPDPARVEEVLEEVRGSAYAASSQLGAGSLWDQIVAMLEGDPGRSRRLDSAPEINDRPRQTPLEHVDK